MTPLEKILEQQKQFFNTNITKGIGFREHSLRILARALMRYEERILEALTLDLHKSPVEAMIGEIGPSHNEISFALKHIHSWTASRRAHHPPFFPLSRGKVDILPHGVSLIFSPYNHPISTTFTPLTSAIAGGNCVVIKPSELVPHSASVIEELIRETFSPEHVTVVQGGIDTSETLLGLPFDHIFFTGSTNVGRSVMTAAAKHLTPVTLQLSGKCPGIVDESASLRKTAKRIAWAKYWNAGQACNTIDHLYVHSSIMKPFLTELTHAIDELYSTEPKKSADYGRILNERHTDRIARYISEGDVVHGGEVDREERYIAPTVITNIRPGATVLTEEVFGPVLPVLPYERLDDVITTIRTQPKALAIYLFSHTRKNIDTLLAQTDSGTACINDVMIQASSPDMPIGGVGGSGFGRLHGKACFDEFTHTRSILTNVTFDVPFRFPPYKESFLLPFLKRLF